MNLYVNLLKGNFKEGWSSLICSDSLSYFLFEIRIALECQEIIKDLLRSNDKSMESQSMGGSDRLLVSKKSYYGIGFVQSQ